MDYPGIRRQGPTMGPRRGENQHYHTRDKSKEENNEHHRTLEGNSRHEEAVDRVENCIDK
jgi:hypothetical protein